MTFRAFIAADLNRHPNMEALQRALGECEGRPKLVNLDILHTTLKFLGDTNEALVPGIVSRMEAAVADVPPVTVALRGVGAFPSLKRINVVWIGLEGAEPLGKIASSLNREMDALGFPPENRAWRPHMTIARVKGGQNVDLVRAVVESHADAEFGETRVDRIRLKRSVLRPEGPEYSTVAEVPLPGEPPGATPSSPDTA